MQKVHTKRCADTMPVHSFRTLLNDLGTICKNTVRVKDDQQAAIFEKITRATAVQQRALDLLGVKLQV
ncbi:MAG: hypothetical protein ACOZF0_19675 [Thermodesulfobacteriota bacterium]